MSWELSVSILHSALDTYVKGVKLEVNSTSNITLGLLHYRPTALDCVEQVLRILGLYEGLAGDTVEQSLDQLQTVNTRSNKKEVARARLEVESESNTLVNVRKPALSVFSVISKVCLLFGEGGHGDGRGGCDDGGGDGHCTVLVTLSI